jgi:hypothetical protein
LILLALILDNCGRWVSWDNLSLGYDFKMEKYPKELFSYTKNLYDSGDTCLVENLPPLADAGQDRTSNVKSTVLLDGTGSYDSDGSIVYYSWTQTAGSTVTLMDADTATSSFTAPASSGTLTFKLTVTDNKGATATDYVNVSVLTGEANKIPTANAGADQTGPVNTPVTLYGTGSYDSDGSIASYAWTQTGGTTVGLTGGNTAMPSFTAPSTDATLTFKLTVTDNKGASASDYVQVFVTSSGGGGSPPPAPPTGVSATAGNGQLTISWNVISGESYNIYWSTSSGVTKTGGTKISNVTSPYTHTGRTNGTTYYYVVTAVDSSGESAESSQVSATPTSQDAGITWTQRTAGTTNSLDDVAWSGTKFVAVGESGTILTSTDGITWSTQVSGTSNSLHGVVWSGTQFVAVGTNNTILTSPDGVTWTKRNQTYYAGYSAWLLEGIVWTGTKFVVAGGDSLDNNGIILTSSDGMTWTAITSAGYYGIDSLWAIAWSGNTFFAVGGGSTYTSSDGTNWNQVSSGFSLYDVIWDGTRFVAIDATISGGIKFFSSDGTSSGSASTGGSSTLYVIDWSGSQYVAVGANGAIKTSLNGSTWSSQTSGITNELYGICWSGTKFVAVGDNGTILTSP